MGRGKKIKEGIGTGVVGIGREEDRFIIKRNKNKRVVRKSKF